VLQQLAEDTLILYLKPPEAMLAKIIERSLLDPKPMYYQSSFLDRVLPEYLAEKDLNSADEIVPNDFFLLDIPSAGRASPAAVPDNC